MNNTMRIAIVAVLAASIVIVAALKNSRKNGKPGDDSNPIAAAPAAAEAATPALPVPATPAVQPAAALPKLIDLGAGKCIPCKAMKPILEDLAANYRSSFETLFIDVWEHPEAADPYHINLIPTQIFFDAAGKELYRHEGFFSKEDILAKWKEFGIAAAAGGPAASFERLTAAQVDNRPKETVCYMCEDDIDPKTLVTVKTEKGDVRLCGPHCYSILYSCLTEDKTDFETKVAVTDFATGNPVPLTEAVYLSGTDADGRPVLQAYAATEAANQARQTAGGNVLGFEALLQNELSHRCGFCDRACYPQDAAEVIVSGGLRTWGCCSHCALGVAARMGKDIEVHERDRLTGDPIIVKTLNGSIASLEPASAVAWFGQRQKPDGTWASAGCFHQGFFTSAENLKKWVEKNAYETGKMITIHQALADKMKLSPEQIQKACKIGECSPK